MWLPEEPDHSTPEPDHLQQTTSEEDWWKHPSDHAAGVILPGLRCPTVSARLPLFTLVMKAQSRPDSVIFPPTTWKHTASELTQAQRRAGEEEKTKKKQSKKTHLESQQRPCICRNSSVLHPLVQQNSTNQTLSILGGLPNDRLLRSHSGKHTAHGCLATTVNNMWSDLLNVNKWHQVVSGSRDELRWCHTGEGGAGMRRNHNKPQQKPERRTKQLEIYRFENKRWREKQEADWLRAQVMCSHRAVTSSFRGGGEQRKTCPPFSMVRHLLLQPNSFPLWPPPHSAELSQSEREKGKSCLSLHWPGFWGDGINEQTGKGRGYIGGWWGGWGFVLP